MKLTPLKIYAIKLAMFSTVLGYMALDLFVFEGPMHGFLHDEEKIRTSELAAEVYGEPITLGQLERFTTEQNTLAGRVKDDPARRAGMIMALVRDNLLRLRARYNDKKLPDCQKAAEEIVQQLESRAENEQAFTAQLASQGYTRRSFTEKIAARMRQQILLERSVQNVSEVDNAAIAAHYKQVREELTIPASRPLRHIFLATEGADANEVHRRAELLLKRLEAGEDFGMLAREASEDDRSAPNGGNLDIIHDNGTFPLPELMIFDATALPAGTPTLAQSRWGWHILLAGPITPAYTPSLDECRESLRTAIISAQRELGVNGWFKGAIKEGFKQKRIIIHAK